MCFDYAPSRKWWCCRKVQFFLVSPPKLLWYNSTIPIAMYHSTIVVTFDSPKKSPNEISILILNILFWDQRENCFIWQQKKINYKGQDDKHWKKIFLETFWCLCHAGISLWKELTILAMTYAVLYNVYFKFFKTWLLHLYFLRTNSRIWRGWNCFYLLEDQPLERNLV